MGRVIDPSIAFQSCHGYRLDDEKMLWSKGVIGTLTDEQEKLCKEVYLAEPVPPKLIKRQEEFRRIAEICARRARTHPRGERLQPYLECISELGKDYF